MLIPTPVERAAGRFMRAPDHDAGDGGGDADKGGDDQVSADGGSDAGESSGEDAAADGDKSLLGGADAGSGDDAAGADAAKDDGDADKAAAGPPETYELKLSIPGEDGKPREIEMDAVLLEKATPVFKEMGFTNEQAQKLAPLALEVQNRMLQQQADNHDAMKADWAKTAKADPEIGGNKFNEHLAASAKALDALGAPKGSDFRALLDDTGLGNHPEMIRMFSKVGKIVGEDDNLVKADGQRKSTKSAEEILYPDDVPTKK